MIRMLHPHFPRLLSPAENEAITRQCIRVVYPDDMTPVFTRLATNGASDER